MHGLQTLHRNLLSTLTLMIDAYWSSAQSHTLIEDEPVLREVRQLIPHALQSLQNTLCMGIGNNDISDQLRQTTRDLKDLALQVANSKNVETPFYAYVWLSLQMLQQLTELNDQLHAALYRKHAVVQQG